MPPPSEQVVAHTPWSKATIGFLLVMVAAVAPLLRQTGARSWRTIWAEDGAVFLTEAYTNGAFEVLLRGYAGYLQLPARVLVVPATALPPAWVPIYLAVAATSVAALLALGVYQWSSALIPSRMLRAAVCVMLVAGPSMGVETTANLTNLIWIFAAAAPWAVVAPDGRRGAIAVRGLVVFLATTATVVTLLFLPLVVLDWWWRRHERGLGRWIVPLSFAVGTVLQLGVVASTSDQIRPESSNSVHELTILFAVHVCLELLAGDAVARFLWVRAGAAVAVAAMAVVFGVIGILVWKIRRAHWRVPALCVTLAGAAVVVFAAPVLGRGTSTMALQPGGPIDGGGARYGVVPIFALFSATAIAVGALAAGSRWERPARIGLLAQALAVVGTSFFVSNGRSSGPVVPAPGAVASCSTAPPSQQVNLPISPPGWSFAVPCEVLQRQP